MIGRLHGKLVERHLDGTCIVDAGGVGYEVSMPARAWDALPPEGEIVTLHIHTHVREDVLALYGFSSRSDRAAFRALLGVSQIGPKAALAILGRLSASQIAQAVARADKAAFKQIPGVGPKTIERLLIDLKDKLSVTDDVRGMAVPFDAEVAARANQLPDHLASVAHALVSLGYKRTEAEHAARTLESTANGKPMETLLREALQALG